MTDNKIKDKALQICGAFFYCHCTCKYLPWCSLCPGSVSSCRGASLVVLMGQVLPSLAVGAVLVVLMGQVLPSLTVGAALVVLMG